MSAASAMTRRNPQHHLRTNLARLRTERGWTQTELARRSKVGQTIISKLESGRQADTSWTNVERLARALGVTPEELAGSEAPVARASLRDERAAVGRADVGELLRLYVMSDWYEEDQPTPDEMRWLASLGVIMWTGAPPTAGTVHVLLTEHRAGRI